MTSSKSQTLTPSDKKFIIENAASMGVPELAASLDKDVTLIRDFLGRAPNVVPKDEISPYLVALRKDHLFKPLRNQYSADELEYFEHQYLDYMSQMNYDVESTEKQQIFQLIELEIMMQRNKAAVKKFKDRIADIERRIRTEMAKGENVFDKNQVRDWQQDLDNVQVLDNGSYEELLKLQKEHASLTKAQSGTRVQRLDKSYSKTSWKDVIKEWVDEKERAKKAKLAAVTKLGYQQELKRLSDYYEYPDGMVDQPVLNSSTLKDDAEFPTY